MLCRVAKSDHDADEIDLILTDLTMPGMTCVQVAAGAWHVRPELPVVLCSGYMPSVDRHEAEAKGIRRFIDKPVDKHELADAVRAVLDGEGTL